MPQSLRRGAGEDPTAQGGLGLGAVQQEEIAAHVAWATCRLAVVGRHRDAEVRAGQDKGAVGVEVELLHRRVRTLPQAQWRLRLRNLRIHAQLVRGHGEVAGPGHTHDEDLVVRARLAGVGHERGLEIQACAEAGHVDAVELRLIERVRKLDDAAPVTTTIGPVRLVDFLPTRVMEVVIHTLDIAEAAGLAVEPSHDALTATLALLSDIAVAHGDGIALAMALSGRRSLPEGFNVLG